MKVNSFSFSRQELGGALADLGTLLPLMTALVVINQLHPTTVLIVVAIAYMASGLYYRIPMPIQPLKALSAAAISMSLSAAVIGAAGILMGFILLFLSLTNLITPLVKLFPQALVRGIQLSIGLLLLRTGVKLAISPPPQPAVERVFNLGGLSIPIELVLLIGAIALFLLFRKSQRFPASVVLIALGLGAGVALGLSPSVEGGWSGGRGWIAWPGGKDFLNALILLVIPQLPLTLSNAVVATWQTAKDYFPERAYRVTPRALTASMGIFNMIAGLFAAMPLCHGSGGLTAHYQLGARTGGANIIIGGLFLVLALAMGTSAFSVIALIPFSVLGTLLIVVGIYHAFLARDLKGKASLSTAAIVAIVTLATGNLALGFASGLGLHYGLSWLGRVPIKEEAAD